MARLRGGEFLMGTDDPRGFPSDGEGPVRRVRVDPFFIGKCAVTNAEFEEFIKQTAYKTEAERFGWSFVFHLLVPTELQSQVDQAALLSLRGGSRSTARFGNSPRGRARTSSTAPTIRSSTSPGTTPSPTATGPVTGCPPKPSGSSPPAAAWSSGASPGATSLSLTASIAATSGRATSPTATPRPTATCPPRPPGPTAPTDSASSTLPVTFGNGAPTGSDAGYARSAARDNPTGPSAGSARVMKRRLVSLPRFLLQSLPSRSAKLQHARQLNRQHGFPRRPRRISPTESLFNYPEGPAASLAPKRLSP